MWALGLTLDTLTPLALAHAAGIVIDDAFMVLEVIVVFIHERKMKPIPAAIAATKEVSLAVLATTPDLTAETDAAGASASLRMVQCFRVRRAHGYQ